MPPNDLYKPSEKCGVTIKHQNYIRYPKKVKKYFGANAKALLDMVTFLSKSLIVLMLLCGGF